MDHNSNPLLPSRLPLQYLREQLVKHRRVGEGFVEPTIFAR